MGVGIMSRIITFEIDNSREDYAHTFQLISQNIVNSDDPWAKEHVKFINASRKKLENEYKDAILQYENEKNETNISNFSGIIEQDDIIYFRVQNKMENDVINLHYFFLARETIQHKYCLAIIQVDEKDKKKYIVEGGIISSFLLYETLSLNESNKFRIVKYSMDTNVKYGQNSKISDERKKGNKKNQYLLELCQQQQENIFLLREDNKNNVKYPYAVNKRRLTISHKFFPQLFIENDFLIILRKMAKEENNNGLYPLAKQKWDERNKSGIIFNDILYSMALRGNYQDIDLAKKESIDNYCMLDNKLNIYEAKNAKKETPCFKLPKIDLVRDILSEYCKKCLEKAVPKMPSGLSGEKRDAFKKKQKELFDSLEKKAAETNVLAFCIFLAFWSFIYDTNIKDNDKIIDTYFDVDGFLIDDVRDDLHTDAQDYADGILQLLENAVIHSLKSRGILCLRIHHTGQDENPTNDSREYLMKRYSVPKSMMAEDNVNGDNATQKTKNTFDVPQCIIANSERKNHEKKYFLEVLISDYNTESDIPRKFMENINTDPTYITEKPDLMHNLGSLKLKDYFDYQINNTWDIWQEFYSDTENLTSHYGLLVFEHIVSFAGGAFRVYSSSISSVLENNIYYKNSINEKDDKTEENKTSTKTDEVHIPGTQYEILLPIGLKHGSHSTGLNAELKIDEEIIEWEAKSIPGEKYANILTDVKLTNIKDIKELIDNLYISLTKEIVEHPLIKQFPCFDVRQIPMPFAAEIFAKTIIKILGKHKNEAPRYFSFINAADGFLATFIRVFSLIYMKSRQNDLMRIKSGASSRDYIDRQIYLCSPEAEKEIVFYGNSLHKSVEATFEIATISKGQPLHEVKILMREEEKAIEISDELTNASNVLPFDCLIPGLYQSKVKADLQRDICETPFGCCLTNTHMRVGSKIHTFGNYYEASLLFGFTSYVSRFAYFLFKNSTIDIEKAISNDPDTKVVLVGYETYSENLVITLKDYLERFIGLPKNQVIDHIIYNEANRDNTFSRLNKININNHTRFIIVVPIGSTLTTHAKIVSDLWRNMQNIYSAKEDFLNAILLHHCVILIRDSGKTEALFDKYERSGIEKLFWKKIIDNEKDKYVIYGTGNNDVSIGAENRINFFVDVSNEWWIPNDCIHCFPKPGEFYKELPLIQSNRASVVPMIMYGKNDKFIPIKYSEEYDDTVKKLASLKAGLCYGHVVRDNENHFEYYFQTDKVMEAILTDENNKFSTWLNELRHIIISRNVDNCTSNAAIADNTISRQVVYDFIVAPLHNTNAAFVYEVNKIIKAKQILWLDTRREYRSNIEAKYSNLRTLYDNLSRQYLSTGKGAEIRFHFVDDSLITGNSFNRAKSLLQSLFPAEAYCENDAYVKTHLFESIILLINRCSRSTQQSYIKTGHFHSYINLNISSMRNHHDACVACTNLNNYKITMNAEAATNKLSMISLKKSHKYEIYNSEKIRTPEEMIIQRSKYKFDTLNIEELSEKDKKLIKLLKDRSYYRLIASHRFNNIFLYIYERQSTKNVRDRIWYELETICEAMYKGSNSNVKDSQHFLEIMDRLFSAIKVITRPFLSFKKIVLEASLQIVLEIAEYCLSGNEICLHTQEKSSIAEGCLVHYINIKRFLDDVKKAPNDAWEVKPFLNLLKIIFSCLANMSSTYLLRVHVMNAVLRYCQDIDDESVAHDIINNYAFNIKQVLCLGGKENLSAWLENMLKKEKEPSKHQSTVILDKSLRYASTLISLLRLENTNQIYYALRECKMAAMREQTWSEKDAVDFLLGDQEQESKARDHFSTIAKDTLKQYFCNAYREFANVPDPNKENEEYNKYCQNTFMPMIYLCYLLDKTHLFAAGKEGSFYSKVLKLSAEILDVNQNSIGLFVTIKSNTGKSESELNIENPEHNKQNDSEIFQLFPNPGEANDSIKDLHGFVNRIFKPSNINENILAVGDTLFLENHKEYRDGTQFAAIKLLNNESYDSRANNTEFYLAFQFNNSTNILNQNIYLSSEKSGDYNHYCGDNTESILIRARNLLSMRNSLVKRLISDYDNNVFDSYLEYRRGFEALGSDKSGSHAPFEELRDTFYVLKGVIDAASDDKIEDLKFVQDTFSLMKIIADSLVSKWYVHSIAKTYPKNLSPKEVITPKEGIRLDKYKKMLQLLEKCRINDDGIFVYSDPSSPINVNFENITIDSPNKFEYMWFCSFFEIYFNALRHGYKIGPDDKTQVKVEVVEDGEFICFRNKKINDDLISDCESITLNGLKYFFNSYYGNDSFISRTTFDNTTLEYYFEVRIPTKQKLNKTQGSD